MLLGLGNGTFVAAIQFPAGQGPSSVAIGDLDGDGRLDLATANAGGSSATILIGR